MYFNLGEGGSEEFLFGGEQGQLVGISIGAVRYNFDWDGCGAKEPITIINFDRFTFFNVSRPNFM